jgi:hypothetical protein
MAGLEFPLATEWLRAARLQIVGSGQGSVPPRDIAGELPALAAHIAQGGFAIDARPTPLRDVEDAWSRPGRVVFVP